MTVRTTHGLSTSVIALSISLAAPAFADITTADIWANQQALYQGMGIKLGGAADGDTLSDITANLAFPDNAATLQVTTDATLSIAPNGDGSVTITYPSPMMINVAGAAEGDGSYSADVIVTHDGFTVIASGDPDDISYTSQASNLRFEPGEITVNNPSTGDDDFELSGFLEMAGWTSNSRVTVGNVISYIAETSYESTEADFAFTVDDVQATNTQTTQPLETSITAALQVGGSDIMNLSEATRNGLTFTVESSGRGSVSYNETLLDGELVNSQATSVGEQSATVSFGEGGAVINGSAENFQLSMNEPLLFPTDLTFAAEGLSMNYAVPLNASDEAQSFRAATSLQGFTMGEELWSLFDPAALLPRDPAEITFDITGLGSNGVDLLDIIALNQMAGPPEIEIDQVSIENLRIAAVGAEIMAEGAVTLDWSDFQTFPGMPRPEGEVTLNINGANALMDKLVAMGVIPEDQLMMPRMMMGMFATPVGDDMLQSVIEVNSEGHLLANGQRLQ